MNRQTDPRTRIAPARIGSRPADCLPSSLETLVPSRLQASSRGSRRWQPRLCSPGAWAKASSAATWSPSQSRLCSACSWSWGPAATSSGSGARARRLGSITGLVLFLRARSGSQPSPPPPSSRRSSGTTGRRAIVLFTAAAVMRALAATFLSALQALERLRDVAAVQAQQALVTAVVVIAVRRWWWRWRSAGSGRRCLRAMVVEKAESGLARPDRIPVTQRPWCAGGRRAASPQWCSCRHPSRTSIRYSSQCLRG